jgi:DNA-directed RNA polymerase specialized sigma24 family protein
MRTREAVASFEEFVQARSGSLMRTALLLTRQNRAEAEDLLQLALERAYRHWPRVIGSGEPERYTRKILANASADRWRRLAAVTGRKLTQIAIWHPGAAHLLVRKFWLPKGMTVVIGPYG